MSDCICLEICPFFNDRMKELPGMSHLYKKKFCQGGESEQCARFMVRNALGKENVPADLYPHQADRAKMLIDLCK